MYVSDNLNRLANVGMAALVLSPIATATSRNALQTLNYVRTPHRFELTLSEPALIGMRQAALRMRGQALAKLAAAPNPSTQEVQSGSNAVACQ